MALKSFALLATFCSSWVSAQQPLPGVSASCQELATSFPPNVLFPGSTQYDIESKHFWDIRSSLKPACIVLPNDATEVAKVVSILVAHRAQFAIRGGGHMNVSGERFYLYRPY
jgi:FAD/FMN-containing dehydrogenase